MKQQCTNFLRLAQSLTTEISKRKFSKRKTKPTKQSTTFHCWCRHCVSHHRIHILLELHQNLLLSLYCFIGSSLKTSLIVMYCLTWFVQQSKSSRSQLFITHLKPMTSITYSIYYVLVLTMNQFIFKSGTFWTRSDVFVTAICAWWTTSLVKTIWNFPYVSVATVTFERLH